ncbi:MAG TPA: hypothetical protein VGR57_06370, partial [Ktedonobacterales bacterium]|nr:hypothetical protein [Ktedonobacterales bacterium]
YVCPAAVSWSPSGALFAVLAQHGRVTSDDANDPCAFSDTVLLFDSHTGKLQKAYPLGATLNHADAYISSPVALSWSPDATMIALPCAVANHRTSGWASDAGVLLVPISKGQPYIVHGFVDMTPSSQKSVVFNIQAGAVASSALYPIPAASRYAVGADGRLDVTRPFASAGLDTADTGSPSGAARTSASFWSSGALVSVSPKDGSNTGVVYYTATVALWSADDAYVDPSLTIGAAGFVPDATSLTTIDPQRCANFVFVPCIATPVPYADRALAAVRTQTVVEAGAHTI